MVINWSFNFGRFISLNLKKFSINKIKIGIKKNKEITIL